MRARRNTLLVAGSITTIALAFLLAGAKPSRSVPSANKKPSPSSASRRAPTEHTLYSGLWRVDGAFVSTAHIKNVLVNAPLAVTPALFMADGTEYDLPALKLDPGGISDLSINDALRSAPPTVQSHLSDFGTLLLRFTSQSATNAAASMQILNEAQSLIFTISSKPFVPPGMPSGQQDLESIWWKHDSGVNASVAIFNASDAAKQVTLNVSGSAGTLRSQSISLNVKNTAILDLEPVFQQLPEPEQLAGGVRVTYEGVPGDIFASTTLANPSNGYSATSEFHPLHTMMAQAPPIAVSYGSVGLMVGAQDPMMGFPQDTRFSPYAVLRNPTASELNVKPLLFLMDGNNPRRVELPSEHFAPNQTKQLSFGSALSNFNGMATLTFSFNGHSGDLLMATGSVDQTGTYVFEVIPDGLSTTWAKNAPFWRVTGGFDAMLTVFNPQDGPEDIVVKLTFVGESGHYAVPLHLVAGETYMLDVKDLIAMQQPDADGNIIPRDVTEGSAQIAGPKGQAQEIRIGASAGVFNVQTATCGGHCLICSQTTEAFIDPNPASTPLSGTQQASYLLTMSDGSQVNYTSSAHWSSSNTSIATVQSTGSSSPGLVSGIAVGTATLTAFAPVPSEEPLPECPTTCPIEDVTATGPAPVTPLILLGGSSGTDITNTTQNVVVGQQIVLYAKYTLPSGESVTSQSWDPGNGSTIVGGYNASPASGSVVTAQTNAQSTTFYWVTPGTSTITFDLTLSGSSSAIPATATFNISAPSPATPTLSLPTNGQLYVDTLTGCTNNPSGPNLVFGNISGPVPGCPGTYTGQPGIAFSPPTASTPAGNFFFVQTVNSDTVNYNSLTCSAISGLDGAYPYQSKTGQAVNDAPFSPLPSTYSTSSRSFNATMYLMWQSTTQASIPAPMGYVTWQFSGSTTQSNGVWGTPTGSGGPGNFLTATSPSFYPTWQGLAVTANNNCH